MAQQETQLFSNEANCYAYAVKCKQPINCAKGQARPGGAVPGADAGKFLEALQAGVLADGGAKVAQLAEFSVNALTTTQIPAPRAGWYLIAMLTNAVGFHFVRRQLKHLGGEPHWKWKQGNKGMVELNAYDHKAKDWVRVTNANFPSLVKGGMGTDGPGYAGWVTVTFFEVHKDGFTVTSS